MKSRVCFFAALLGVILAVILVLRSRSPRSGVQRVVERSRAPAIEKPEPPSVTLAPIDLPAPSDEPKQVTKSQARTAISDPGPQVFNSVRVDTRGFIPEKDWQNVGDQTASNALETFLWAASNGEIEKLGELIEFVKPPKLDDVFRGMSDDARMRYGAPKKVAALMFAASTGTAVEMREVTELKTGSSSAAHITANFNDSDGNIFSQVFWVSHRPEGWRIMVHGLVVERFVAGDQRPGLPIFKRGKMGTPNPPRGK